MQLESSEGSLERKVGLKHGNKMIWFAFFFWPLCEQHMQGQERMGPVDLKAGHGNVQVVDDGCLGSRVQSGEGAGSRQHQECVGHGANRTR